MKNGFYMDDQVSGWTKKKIQSTSQSQICTKIRSWSLFGVLLLVWSTSFLNPSETITSESLSKLVRCTKNCNTCSWHWSTERAWFFSMTAPDHRLHNQQFKSWMNWATKFCLICHIHLTSWQLTKTSSNILITFCMENASTTSRRQMMPSKIWSNSKA